MVLMFLKLMNKRWFWEVAAELFLLELAISFMEHYEEAKADARRRIYGDRDQPKV